MSLAPVTLYPIPAGPPPPPPSQVPPVSYVPTTTVQHHPRVDSTPLPEPPVQFYVTFADAGKIPYPTLATVPSTPSIPVKQRIEAGKVYNKSPSPPESLAAPDLLTMTEVWEKEFRVIFAAFLPNNWYLFKTNQSPSPRWRKFKDSAKVRFCCQACGHAWTSMKGRVMFWFFLNPDPNYPEGFLHYKLYGQQCNTCQNGVFEDAMWYPEEVNKVLCNVYNKIGQSFYGFAQLPIRQDRRPGRPRTQHNSALCQACFDGECYRAGGKFEEKKIAPLPATQNATVPLPPHHSQRLLLPLHQTIVQHNSTSISPVVY